jgi:hypothetical protein
MDGVWQQLQREWGVIRQVPLLFCSTWMLGLIATWALVEKLYRSRLEARDDLLRGYQQKLGLGPFKKRAYSRLKNLELKNKAIELAQSIRAFTAMADSQISAESANFSSFWPYVASQYSNDFKVASVLLRDEILTRLSQSAGAIYQKSDPKGMMAFVYQNPVHTHSMEMVADDLDKLAKMLPS